MADLFLGEDVDPAAHERSGTAVEYDLDADPMSSPEHILLSNLVERAWTSGTILDLGVLVQQVQDPPIRKLGVLELDSFYPAKDRTSEAERQFVVTLLLSKLVSWTEVVTGRR